MKNVKANSSGHVREANSVTYKFVKTKIPVCGNHNEGQGLQVGRFGAGLGRKMTGADR